MAQHKTSRSAPRPVALIGGGGHALVVAEAIAPGADVVGFYDDNPNAVLGRRLRLQYLGPFAAMPHPLDAFFILAVGSVRLRRTLIERLAGDFSVGVTHARAYVAPTASIGPGVFIAPHSSIHTLAEIGSHAIINTGAIVEHECTIGENTHIAPGAVLGGNVHIGPDTLIGLGSRILPGVRVGAGCVIGAGAVVIRDVPDGSAAMGVPAHPVRLVAMPRPK